jgi:pyochelin synthetase
LENRNRDWHAQVPPRDAVELQLLDIWRDALGVDDIGVTDDFFDVGGSSADALKIVGVIRRRFRRRLPLDTFFAAATVEEMARLLRARRRLARTCLVPMQPDGSRRPLFAVHTLGGTVMHYAELARALGADQPFYGFQATGIAGSRPQRTVPAMARRYVRDIRTVQGDGPYQLCGYSGGGVIAWEMACQLAEMGQATSALFLIDTRPVTELPLDPAYWVDLLAHRFLGLSREAIELARQPSEIQLDSILRAAHRNRQVPPDYGPGELELVLRHYMTSAAALNAYRPRRYEGRALLIRTDEQTDEADETLGWGAFSELVRVRRIGADHYNVISDAQAPLVAGAVRAYLDGDR